MNLKRIVDKDNSIIYINPDYIHTIFVTNVDGKTRTKIVISDGANKYGKPVGIYLDLSPDEIYEQIKF